MREMFLSSSPTATLCCFNKMFLLASFHLISRTHHTDTSSVNYLQVLHFPSVDHTFLSFSTGNTSFPVSLFLSRLLGIIGAHDHVISSDKPCIREENGQRAFPAPSYVNHPHHPRRPSCTLLSTDSSFWVRASQLSGKGCTAETNLSH